MVTRTEFVNDRNIEECFSWLNDQLNLTAEEQQILNSFYYGNEQNRDELRKKIKEETRQAIVDSYGKLSAIETARKYNTTSVTVYRYWKAAGFEIAPNGGRPLKLTKDEIEWLIEACKTMTSKEIAEKLKVTPNYVWRTAKKHGTKPQMRKNTDKNSLNWAETEILKQAAEGLNNIEIAYKTGYSSRYVGKCMIQVYNKIGVDKETNTMRRVKAVLHYINNFKQS